MTWLAAALLTTPPWVWWALAAGCAATALACDWLRRWTGRGDELRDDEWGC